MIFQVLILEFISKTVINTVESIQFNSYVSKHTTNRTERHLILKVFQTNMKTGNIIIYLIYIIKKALKLQ